MAAADAHLLVACPHCGAARGLPCKLQSGAATKALVPAIHWARRRDATRAVVAADHETASVALFTALREFIRAAGVAVTLDAMRAAFPGWSDNTLRTTAARLAREPGNGITRLGNGKYWAPDAVGSTHADGESPARAPAARQLPSSDPRVQAEDARSPSGVGGRDLRLPAADGGVPDAVGPGGVPAVRGRGRRAHGDVDRAGASDAAPGEAEAPAPASTRSRRTLVATTVNLDEAQFAELKAIGALFGGGDGYAKFVREGLDIIIDVYDRWPPHRIPTGVQMLNRWIALEHLKKTEQIR